MPKTITRYDAIVREIKNNWSIKRVTEKTVIEYLKYNTILDKKYDKKSKNIVAIGIRETVAKL